MTLKRINVYLNEIYRNGPNWNYITNKTNVYYVGKIWSVDILDLKDYGSKKMDVTDVLWLWLIILAIFVGQFLGKRKLLKP